jgi:hypothetical protein
MCGKNFLFCCNLNNFYLYFSLKAYKRWNKLRVSGFHYLQLVDLDPDKQTMLQVYPPARVSNISRCSSRNQAHVYKFSDECMQRIIDILDQK